MVASGTVVVGASDDAQLEDLLTRLTQSARQYGERALNFTCEEKIAWYGRSGEGGREKFGYVVATAEDGRFEDYRTRLRRFPTNKPPKRVDPLDYNVPRFLRSPYFWIFVFRQDRRDMYEFRMLGREEIEGLPAVKIGFEPVPPYEEKVNDWFGTAWVDPQNAQLLKVDGYTVEDWQTLKRMEAHLAGEGVTGALYIVEKFTTEFSVVNKKMRFPSRVEMRRVEYDISEKLRGGTQLAGQSKAWKYDTIPRMQVDQTYKNYKFFGVRTEQQLSPPPEQ